MKKKIIGIFVCMLLILTVLPVSGHTEIFIGESNDFSEDTEAVIISLSNDTWMKTFGGIKSDAGFSLQLTSDGGYIIVGATKSYGSGRYDIWLIKTDNQGDMIWDKTFGGEDDDYGCFIQQTSDGGYIITGKTESYSNGKTDAWLIKTDSDGNKLWDKTFGYGIFDSGSEVRQTSDGGYIVVGSVNVTGGPRGDIWLIKTDSNGDIIWDKVFGGIGHNYGNSILITNDGGYLLVGSSFISQETNGYQLWLIKTDDAGEILWDKKHGGAEFDTGWCIQPTNDGCYIITGETGSYGAGDTNAWLLKIDITGEELWNKTFGGDDIDRGCTVQQTNNGGFIIAGHTTRYKSYEAWLIKTNSDGDEEWIKTYGKKLGCDMFFSVKQTPDGGYIITGDTTSYRQGIGHNKGDVWLLKADSNGNVPINKAFNFNVNLIEWLFERFPNAFPILRHLIEAQY